MSGINFTLDPRIESDSVFICDLELCHVRLHKNAAFPWIMLMPRRAGMVEIFDLSADDRAVLWAELERAAAVMTKIYGPKKLNIANLGNVTPQLHIHVIARFDTDGAWPGPVWNSGVTTTYDHVDATVQKIRNGFAS